MIKLLFFFKFHENSIIFKQCKKVFVVEHHWNIRFKFHFILKFEILLKHLNLNFIKPRISNIFKIYYLELCSIIFILILLIKQYKTFKILILSFSFDNKSLTISILFSSMAPYNAVWWNKNIISFKYFNLNWIEFFNIKSNWNIYL